MIRVNYCDVEKFGLTAEEVDKIGVVFSKHPQIEKVLLYGSRAMGNYKPASDIDLTLIGSQIDLTLLQIIELELDDLMFPYKFDISIYHKINNPDFLDHIKRRGVEFYKKDIKKPTSSQR